MERTFTKQELKDMDLPAPVGDGEGCKVLSDKIVDTSRWSVHHALIFRIDGQSESQAWKVMYQRGATEYQEERPWENEDTITATLVELVEKTVKVWQPVPAEKPAV